MIEPHLVKLRRRLNEKLAALREAKAALEAVRDEGKARKASLAELKAKMSVHRDRSRMLHNAKEYLHLITSTVSLCGYVTLRDVDILASLAVSSALTMCSTHD